MPWVSEETNRSKPTQVRASVIAVRTRHTDARTDVKRAPELVSTDLFPRFLVYS